jgi:branched-chain amino acid transport system substrate-binding protein
VIGADKNKNTIVAQFPGRVFMPGRKVARLFVGLSAAIAVLGMTAAAEAQEKKIKIGVVYDLTGPLAGGGSELQ